MLYENNKKSYVRSPLNVKFKELVSKYEALVDMCEETQSSLYKVYSSILEDLKDLESICEKRKRY